MAEFTFGNLIESAAEAGYGPDEILTPGTYEADVVLANAKRSSSGKAGWGVKFKVVGGPHDGAGVWNNFYLSPESPAALSIFFRDLASLGVTSEFLNGLNPENDTDCEKIAEAISDAGRAVKIKVKTGEWNGEAKNEVDRISKSNRASNGADAPQADVPAQRSGGSRPQRPF
jgi:hypothetical protein